MDYEVIPYSGSIAKCARCFYRGKPAKFIVITNDDPEFYGAGNRMMCGKHKDEWVRKMESGKKYSYGNTT